MTLPDAVNTGAELPQPSSSSPSSPVDPRGPRSRTARHASALCSSSAKAPCAVSTSSLCTRATVSSFLYFVVWIYSVFFELFSLTSDFVRFPKNVFLRDGLVCWLPFARAMSFSLNTGVSFVKGSVQHLRWHDPLTHASRDLNKPYPLGHTST